MADTDMDGLKPLSSALTSVKGIGVRSAIQICKATGFDPARMAGHLSPEQQETLRHQSKITSTTFHTGWSTVANLISKPATTST